MSQASSNLRTAVVDGLWRNNLTFVQLLGLSPLLAVTISAGGIVTIRAEVVAVRLPKSMERPSH